jgi:hypothetical protein
VSDFWKNTCNESIRKTSKAVLLLSLKCFQGFAGQEKYDGLIRLKDGASSKISGGKENRQALILEGILPYFAINVKSFRKMWNLQ